MLLLCFLPFLAFSFDCSHSTTINPVENTAGSYSRIERYKKYCVKINKKHSDVVGLVFHRGTSFKFGVGEVNSSTKIKDLKPEMYTVSEKNGYFSDSYSSTVVLVMDNSKKESFYFSYFIADRNKCNNIYITNQYHSNYSFNNESGCFVQMTYGTKEYNFSETPDVEINNVTFNNGTYYKGRKSAELMLVDEGQTFEFNVSAYPSVGELYEFSLENPN